MSSTPSDWLRSAGAYLQDKGRDHLLPALVMLGSQLLGIPVFLVGYLVFVLGFAFVDRAAWAPLVGVAVFGAVFVVYLAAMQVLTHGYLAGTFRSMRGEGFPLSVFVTSLRQLPAMLGLFVVTFTLSGIGALFCYLPGLAVGVLLSMAPSALVDRNQGVMDALATSYDLVRGRFWEVAVCFGALILAIVCLSFLPIVGGALGLVAYQVGMATMYLFLVRDQARTAA